MTSKARQIVEAIHTRVSGIAGGVTFVRGVRQFNEVELPAYAVYRQPSEVEESQNSRARLLIAVVVEGHKDYSGSEPSDVGEDMIEAIRGAVETDDLYLGGLLRRDLSLAGETIVYPEDAGTIVSAQVIYTAAYVTHWGDPAA